MNVDGEILFLSIVDNGRGLLNVDELCWGFGLIGMCEWVVGVYGMICLFSEFG